MNIDNIQGGVYTPEGYGNLFVCLNPESIENLGKAENIDIALFVVPEFQKRILKVLRFSLIENGTFDELFNNFGENNGKDIELYVRKKHQLNDDNKNGVLSSNEKLEEEIIMGYRSIFAEFENTVIIEITRKLLERLLEHITGKEASDGYTYPYHTGKDTGKDTGKEESHIIDFFIKDSNTKKRIKDQIRFYAQLNEYLNPDGTYKYNGICNIPQILKGDLKENL